MNQEDRQQADSQEADHQDMGFEEQLFSAIFTNEQLDHSIYDKILQRLKEKVSLSEALNDCKALVDQGKISVSQLIVAIYDYQCANIPIKEALWMRGWLNQ